MAALFVVGVWAASAHGAEQLLVTTPLVQGSLATDTAFKTPGSGTVTVILSDLDWPTKLASLTFAATAGSAVLASLSGAGQTSFQVGAAGFYNAIVGAVATPSGFLDLGWYSMTIDFTPAASPVALPESGLLLASGLAALVALRRRTRAWLLSARGGLVTS